jgi:ribokinase
MLQTISNRLQVRRPAAVTTTELHHGLKMQAIVVGSANTDLIINVEEVPRAGETRIGQGFGSGPGGKGANQAVCLARLGAETHLVARFGWDGFSTMLREEIESHGVDLSFSVVDKDKTGGIVFIIVDKGGNNTMVADLGSNLALSAEDVSRAERLFESADLLLLQLEVPEEANLEACELARGRGVPVVMNPAPMRGFHTDFLSLVDLFTPNVQELAEILELLEGKPVISTDERDLQTIGRAASRLRSHGAGNIIVTAGSAGCVHVGEKDVRSYGVYEVQPVDATAAGDSFTAALSMKYSETGDMESSIPFALACAAITVTRPGAIPSLPSRQEVEEFLKNHG